MPALLSDVEWVRRAAARILQLDDVIRPSDATVLAAAIAQRGDCRRETPEAAVDMTFLREGRDIRR